MISKTCGYGIRGVVLLAVKSDEHRNIVIHEIAEDLDVPQHFMGKIMQDLVRKGVIFSIKGPNGGFYVKDETLEMPLIKIIEAIDGLGVLKKCFMGREECSEENPCPLHHEFAECRNGIFKTFRNKTVKDLTEEVADGLTFLKL
jgi:Rrf2 family protein